jgi:hypothetical protein
MADDPMRGDVKPLQGKAWKGDIGCASVAIASFLASIA